MTNYRKIRFGVERVASGDVPRHIHCGGYANVVLSGAFTEASFQGRFRASPGIVLLHTPFDCHANVEGAGGSPTILRLPWRGSLDGAFRFRDPDRLAALCERDPHEAEFELAEGLEPVEQDSLSWADELATALKDEPVFELRCWAEQRSLSPATLSRGFRDAYGVSPQRYRLEARTRIAWGRIVSENTPLTQIAHECSFSDLSHMSRSVVALTDGTPSLWRQRSSVSALRQGER